jgi:hypothetical protein
VDGVNYYKESEKSSKKSNKTDSNIYTMVQPTNLKSTKDRYTLNNFVV